MIPLSPPICPVQPVQNYRFLDPTKDITESSMNLDTFMTQITLSSTKIPTAAPVLHVKLKPHL